MMKGKLLLIAGLFVSGVAYADYYGTLTETGGEGEYMVSIEDDTNGHVYNGKALDLGDGKLRVTVRDSQETYQGSAIEDETGDFYFDLKNNTSGHVISGSLEEYEDF